MFIKKSPLSHTQPTIIIILIHLKLITWNLIKHEYVTVYNRV